MHGKAGPVKTHTLPGAHLLLGVPAGAGLEAAASWSHLEPFFSQTRGKHLFNFGGSLSHSLAGEVTAISAKERPPALLAAASPALPQAPRPGPLPGRLLHSSPPPGLSPLACYRMIRAPG